MIPVVLGAGGALVFGLIAAAAVFSSGSDDFLGKPVGWSALAGGSVFLYSVFAVATLPKRPRVVRWLFEKRPKRLAMSESGGPEDAAARTAADAAEGGTASRVPGDDLPASADTSQRKPVSSPR
jgi:hypothetical protein